MTTLPDICKCMSRCDNVGGHGEHVTCHMFCLLRRPFFFFSICLGSRCAIARWPILTIYTSTICVLGVPLLLFPFQGIRSPKHQFWGREDAFSSPTANYWNMYIVNQICTTTKSTKCISCVAQILRQQIPDGGRPPFVENRSILMKFSIVMHIGPKQGENGKISSFWNTK